jgi:predicted transcriptional regulator
MDRARSEIEIIFEILSTCDREDFMTQNAVFLAGERVLNPVSGALYVRAMLEAGVLEADVQDWRGLQLVRVRSSPAGRALLARSRDAMAEYRSILDMLTAIRRGD